MDLQRESDFDVFHRWIRGLHGLPKSFESVTPVDIACDLGKLCVKTRYHEVKQFRGRCLDIVQACFFNARAIRNQCLLRDALGNVFKSLFANRVNVQLHLCAVQWRVRPPSNRLKVDANIEHPTGT